MKKGTLLKSLIDLPLHNIKVGTILKFKATTDNNPSYEIIVIRESGFDLLVNWSEVEVADHQQRLSLKYGK